MIEEIMQNELGKLVVITHDGFSIIGYKQSDQKGDNIKEIMESEFPGQKYDVLTGCAVAIKGVANYPEPTWTQDFMSNDYNSLLFDLIEFQEMHDAEIVEVEISKKTLGYIAEVEYR